MIRPAVPLLRLIAAWALLGLAPVVARALHRPWQEPVLWLWASAGLVLLVAFAADVTAAARRRPPTGTRLLPAAFSVLRPHPIRLRFDNGGLPPAFEVADLHPDDDAGTGLPRRLARQPGTVTEVLYPYRPGRRGEACFGDIDVWLPGPLGLCWKRWRLPARTTRPVYPDFSLLQQDGLHATPESRIDPGTHRQRRRGEGFEFLQLREYRPGDSLRQVDWKASARRRRLISREYHEEENQQLIVMLDGGERLAARAAGMSAFDHALNATLLLSWSAVKHGDKPGVLVFSGDRDCWVPPARGRQSVNRILGALYPLQPGGRASDYSQAASVLTKRWPRHALVVLVTRLQPDDLDEVLTAVRLLGRHHIPLIADIALSAQAAIAGRVPTDMDQALLVCGDAHWQEGRRALHARLRHAGAIVVEATPERLAARLNRSYLALKRSGRL